MKPKTSKTFIGTAVVAAVVGAGPAIAQDASTHVYKHHHYKLVDLDTFGGPTSGVFIEPTGNIANLAGDLVGVADTASPTPVPDCYNPVGNIDCFISHAFVWRGNGLRDLGTLPGGYYSFATAINLRGQIAGVSENNRTDPAFGYPEFRAVLWENGKIRDLGTLGGTSSFATSMSDWGHIVGPALNSIPDPYSILGIGSSTTSTQTRAFLWDGGKMRDLGTLGGPDSWPYFVNNRGQVAGMSNTSFDADPNCGMPAFDPFLWDNGKMKDLGNFGGTNNPFFCGSGAGVVGLNNRGQVAGTMTLPGDQISRAFLWDGVQLFDLGTLGGSAAYASGLNDAGVVVGIAATPGDQVFPAFRWENGVMTDLGNLDGTLCSNALSINSKGQIVGGSNQCDAWERAFLWENGGPLVDLNDLTPHNPSRPLRNAVMITDGGEIIALRAPPGCAPFTDSCLRPSVLIPCDENHPGIKGCDYSLVDVADVARTSPAQIDRPSAPTRVATLALTERMARLRSTMSNRNRWVTLLRTLAQK